jgi:hypothetical protein
MKEVFDLKSPRFSGGLRLWHFTILRPLRFVCLLYALKSIGNSAHVLWLDMLVLRLGGGEKFGACRYTKE